MEDWLKKAWEELGYDIEKDQEESLEYTTMSISKKDKEKPRKYTDMYNELHGNSTVKDKKCDHDWCVTGRSPISNEVWENCKHCDIAKEDV